MTLACVHSMDIDHNMWGKHRYIGQTILQYIVNIFIYCYCNVPNTLTALLINNTTMLLINQSKQQSCVLVVYTRSVKESRKLVARSQYIPVISPLTVLAY